MPVFWRGGRSLLRAECGSQFQTTGGPLHWDYLTHLLKTADYRTLIIVGTETLNEQLRRLFRFRCHDATHKRFDAMFNGTGPLASFSSRIDLAYFHGYFPKDTYDDLHVIRRIRNEVAHSFRRVDFQSGAIADLSRQLKTHLQSSPGDSIADPAWDDDHVCRFAQSKLRVREMTRNEALPHHPFLYSFLTIMVDLMGLAADAYLKTIERRVDEYKRDALSEE